LTSFFHNPTWSYFCLGLSKMRPCPSRRPNCNFFFTLDCQAASSLTILSITGFITSFPLTPASYAFRLLLYFHPFTRSRSEHSLCLYSTLTFPVYPRSLTIFHDSWSSWDLEVVFNTVSGLVFWSALVEPSSFPPSPFFFPCALRRL